MKAIVVLATVVILAGLCESKTDVSLLKKFLMELMDKKEADNKRAMTNIAVTSTSITGYPSDWGECPSFNCTYVISCGNAGSKEAKLADKVVFDELKPSTAYTCTTCLKGDSSKCSATVWTCTTLQKGENDAMNNLNVPCRSKIVSKKEVKEINNINKIKALLALLAN